MHNQIKVAYSLYIVTEGAADELVERATAAQPFQFITGFGIALEAFEERVAELETGANFDFTLTPDLAFGDYDEEHVITLQREMFNIGGKFDSEHIFPGNVIPLENEDGNRFQGTILEVKADGVVVDLNPPLAGKTLKFVGFVVENRPATDEEIQGTLNMLSGEGCNCGCEGHEHCHHEDSHCHHEDGHHHHGDGHCHCGHKHE